MNGRSLQPDDPLTRQVIGEAMYVHRVLGPGFMELVYHNALLLRLKKLGLDVEREKSLPVHFDGEVIGVFIADLVVENRLILELRRSQLSIQFTKPNWFII